MPGGLSKTGDGTLVLTKTNTYSGATSIGAGTLQADTTNIIAASSGLSMSGGVFDLHSFNQTLKSLSGSAGAITTGTGVLTIDSNASTGYAGSVSGNGKMIKQGTGTLTLSGSVSLLDPTSVLQINAGSLVGSSSNNNIQTTKVAINSGSQLLLINSASLSTATLSVGDSTTGSNTVSVITGAHASVTDNLYLGFFNGSTGVLNINGTGSLVDATNVQVGYGATSSGTINLNSNGTLQAESLNRGTERRVESFFDNGVLRAKADNSSFINGFSAGDLLLNAGGGTVDSNGFNIATNNVFSGTGKLTKAGAGVFTLTGLNTYTGGTSVSGGTLRLTGAGNPQFRCGRYWH
ncbi:Type V secretory pathway, adhesin AidA [Budvicia aquatica]|uniref:Type V secretory pathway, adhesin AidA n=2 Tax=Budvicia aquatica TaxID=82979 RepID=A0A484ZQ86_9GAMM|nr:Type V secretory pathway, adhesin AidA [Budvicia aquatica]